MWWQGYIGTPFSEKGRDHSGLDCWGLVRLVYAEKLGVDLPSYAENYRDSNDREVLTALVEAEKKSRWLAVEKPKPYDVIILTMMGLPTHVGVVVNSRQMLHILKGTNAVLEDFTGLKWRNRVKGFARWEI